MKEQQTIYVTLEKLTHCNYNISIKWLECCCSISFWFWCPDLKFGQGRIFICGQWGKRSDKNCICFITTNKQQDTEKQRKKDPSNITKRTAQFRKIVSVSIHVYNISQKHLLLLAPQYLQLTLRLEFQFRVNFKCNGSYCIFSIRISMSVHID